MNKIRLSYSEKKRKALIELYGFLYGCIYDLKDAKQFAEKWSMDKISVPAIDCTMKAMANHLSRIVEKKGIPEFLGDDDHNLSKYGIEILDCM